MGRWWRRSDAPGETDEEEVAAAEVAEPSGRWVTIITVETPTGTVVFDDASVYDRRGVLTITKKDRSGHSSFGIGAWTRCDVRSEWREPEVTDA